MTGEALAIDADAAAGSEAHSYVPDTDQAIIDLLDGKETLSGAEKDRVREWLIDQAIAKAAKQPPVTLESIDGALRTVQSGLQNNSDFNKVKVLLNRVHIPFSDQDMDNRTGAGSPADVVGRNWTLRALLKAYMIGNNDQKEPLVIGLGGDDTKQYSRASELTQRGYQIYSMALEAFAQIPWTSDFDYPAIATDSRELPSKYLRKIILQLSDPQLSDPESAEGNNEFWRVLTKFPGKLAKVEWSRMTPAELLELMSDQVRSQSQLDVKSARGGQAFSRALVNRMLASEQDENAQKYLTVLFAIEDPMGLKVTDEQLKRASGWFRKLTDDEYLNAYDQVLNNCEALRQQIADDLVADTEDPDSLRRLVQFHLRDIEDDQWADVTNRRGFYELLIEKIGTKALVASLPDQLADKTIEGISTQYSSADMISDWLQVGQNDREIRVESAQALMREQIFAHVVTMIVAKQVQRLEEQFKSHQISETELPRLLQFIQQVHEDPMMLFDIRGIDTSSSRDWASQPTIKEEIIAQAEFVRGLMSGQNLEKIMDTMMEIHVSRKDIVEVYNQVVVAMHKGTQILGDQLGLNGDERFLCLISDLKDIYQHDSVQHSNMSVVIGYERGKPVSRSLMVNTGSTTLESSQLQQVMQLPVDQWVGGLFEGVHEGLVVRRMMELVAVANKADHLVGVTADSRFVLNNEILGNAEVLTVLKEQGVKLAEVSGRIKNLEQLQEFFEHVHVVRKRFKRPVLEMKLNVDTDVWSMDTALLWYGTLFSKVDAFDPKKFEDGEYNVEIEEKLKTEREALKNQQQQLMSKVAGSLLGKFVTQEKQENNKIRVTAILQPKVAGKKMLNTFVPVNWVHQGNEGGAVDLSALLQVVEADLKALAEELKALDASLVTDDMQNSPIMAEVKRQLSTLVYQHLRHRLDTFDASAVDMSRIPENLQAPLKGALKKIEQEAQAALSL